ncbi:hypothetical protein [Pseudomonas profundi]|uniref:hypothetical protein n=1 Tax=Pseudomonas profundi TaxID=1981513 RepID=UPI0012396DAD|nr:hypothetical protein [Pseudomonas profundi]
MSAASITPAHVKYTVFGNKAALSMSAVEQSWDKFCKQLEDLKPTHKDSSNLIKFALFSGEKTEPTASGKGGCLRADSFVTCITGIEGDYDGGIVTPEQARDLLEQHGIKGVIVTSHSHTPEKPRWRVYCPLSKSHSPNDRTRFIQRLNGALGGILAGESFTLSQSYYVGRPQHGGEYKVLPTCPIDESCIDELDALDAIAMGKTGNTVTSARTGTGGKPRREILEQLLQGEDVHGNALVLVGKWLARGMTDDEIRLLMESTAPYVAEQRDAERAGCLLGSELQRMIDGGRAKGYGEKASQGNRQAAERLAYGITQSLCSVLAIDPEKEPAKVESLGVDLDVIHAIVTGCFWSGVKAKVFMLGDDDELLQFIKDDASGFIVKRFGNYFNAEAVEALALDLAAKQELTDSKAEKLIMRACGVPGSAIMRHLKYHNQRDSLEWRVDMFAEHSRIEIIEDKVRVILRHKPLFAGAHIHDARVVPDYREHFPRIDDFIELLVAARFAGDRKKAYLWLFAETDWGKGILLGALSQLGLVVNLSVKEVEAMFEGRPVGRSPLDFKRAFILAIDEFKTVKAELKQLQSTIELAPKHQLTSSVEVFTKLFLSAESVASLVGENGVEDQFANRMSIFREHGSIEKRPLFNEVGKNAYRNAIADYVAQRINHAVHELRKLGRDGATREADAAVTKFHKRYGLDTVYQRFSESLPDLVQQFMAWIKSNEIMYLVKHRENVYLLSPNLTIDEFISKNLTQSEAGAMRRKKPEIIDLISVDGKGVHSYRIPAPTKAVMIG